MKTLTTSALKVLKLSLVIVALASSSVIAGGTDDKIESKKSDADTYAAALVELKNAFSEAEQLEKSFTPSTIVKIYDTNFRLIKEATIPEDGMIEDRKLLKLLRQSSELMKYEYMTYYMLNN